LYFAARNLATLNTLRGGYLWGGVSLGVIWGCLVWRQLCRGDSRTLRTVNVLVLLDFSTKNAY